MGFYDQFSRTGGGEYEQVKWQKKGEVVEGVVVQRGATDFGGTRKAGPVPELILRGEDKVERQVACSQANLYYQILELQPDMGDHVRIEYQGADESKKKPGQSAPMIFAVKVTPKAMMADKGSTGTSSTSAPPADEDPF
jgi:hypothetical protein